MSRWFRFYSEALNDPKVQRLGPDLFKAWVNLMCLAAQNNGEVKSCGEAAFALRLNEQRAAAIVTELAVAGLLDKVEDGYYAPHNWKGRQYLSDSSAERVKRHRERRSAAGLESQWTAPAKLRRAIYERDGHRCVYCQGEDDLTLDHKTPESRGGTHDPENLQTCCRPCNAAKRDFTHEEFVTRNAGVTLQQRPQTTEQNTESEQTKSESTERARRASVSGAFKRFEEKYPKRDGANPREPARKKFEAACKGGVDPEAIVGGAERYALECQRKNIVGTEKVAQAITFLSQQRWKDYPPATETPAAPVEIEPGHGRFYPAIVKRLGEQVAASWFRGLRLVRIEGDVLHLTAPTKFVADRIRSFYDAELLLAVHSVDPTINLVEVTVADKAAA